MAGSLNGTGGAAPTVVDALDTIALAQSPADAYYGSEDGPAVGDALDVVDDPMASRIAAGGVIEIKSQAEWNALPPAQKEYLRAMQAAGGEVRTADALRAYQAASRAQQARQVVPVDLPDGRQAALVGNNLVLPKEREAVKMERVVNEDGIVTLVDTTSGRSFPAWDETTGQPVRAQRKMSESERLELARSQKMLDAAAARVQGLQGFEDGDRVSWDEGSGTFVKSWFGSPAGKLRDAEMVKLKRYEGEVMGKGEGGRVKAEVEGGSLKPAADGFSSAQDVAAAFQAGKIDREGAKKILAERFNIR